jgi:acyl-CoA synthetase (AMP-forming)/AMP-acid ligase II
VLVPRWSPGDALRWVSEHGVTFMIGPPTYFAQLRLERGFSSAAVSSLRLISCGGAGVTEVFARDTAAAFDCVVKRTYGSTEAPTITTSFAGDPPERGWSTDGRAVSDEVMLRIDEGQLLVRAPELFDGYDGMPDPFVDGWFATGDRAELRGGWLTILGRLGDGIIRGGENIDPVEVETVCAALPGVRQVVCVGVPDEVMGERVGLVVVGASYTAQQVKDHCAAAGLARFKVPEVVLRCDELPVLTVGKPDRRALARLLAAES